MYSRFLLCHLRDPLDVIRRWVTQLDPGGLLFIEEIDAIATTVEVFKTYLAMGEGIIATQGASLYVGKTVAEAEHGIDVLFNGPVVLPVMNWQAARWGL